MARELERDELVKELKLVKELTGEDNILALAVMLQTTVLMELVNKINGNKKEDVKIEKVNEKATTSIDVKDVKPTSSCADFIMEYLADRALYKCDDVMKACIQNGYSFIEVKNTQQNELRDKNNKKNDKIKMWKDKDGEWIIRAV